jgi:N-methylhydantoinase A
LGLLLSDHLIDEMRSYITPVGRVDVARVNALFTEMDRAAKSLLQQRRGTHRRVELRRFLNLCYPGQTFDMAVPLTADGGRLTRRDLGATVERFHALHEQLHTYASRDEEPILRSLRLTAVGVSDKPSLPTIASSSSKPPLKARRPAYFGGKFVSTPVYDGPKMRVGHRVEGPAIIEEPFTTIVLHPGQTASLDRFGNYRIAIG